MDEIIKELLAAKHLTYTNKIITPPKNTRAKIPTGKTSGLNKQVRIAEAKVARTIIVARITGACHKLKEIKIKVILNYVNTGATILGATRQSYCEHKI